MIINRIATSLLHCQKAYTFGSDSSIKLVSNRQLRCELQFKNWFKYSGKNKRLSEKDILNFSSNIEQQYTDSSILKPSKKNRHHKLLNMQEEMAGSSAFTNNNVDAPTSTIKSVRSLTKNLKFITEEQSLTEIIVNTTKLMEILACIFNESENKRFLSEIKSYVSKMQQVEQSDEKALQKRKKRAQHQRNLFNNVYMLLDEVIDNEQCILQTLDILSTCDPKILKEEDIRKYYAMEDEENINPQQFKSKINLIYGIGDRESSKKMLRNQLYQSAGSEENFEESYFQDFSSENKEVFSPFRSSEQDFYDPLKPTFPVDMETIHHEPVIKQGFTPKKNNTFSSGVSAGKLFIKKKSPSFQIKEESLNQIDHRLFKNQKIVNENITFKKQTKNAEEIQRQRLIFGENWIYAYELPYNIEKETFQKFIDYIEKSYGKLSEYVLFPYKNMLQKERKEIHYVIPDMVNMERSKKANRIQKRYQSQPIPSIEEQSKQKKNTSKTTAEKIMQKIRKQKQFKLNKSSMLMRFQKNQDKLKMIEPETRLFGINLHYFNNIRFEEAQSKNYVALSMIPWGCSTNDLLATLNQAISHLNISLTFPSCIMAKSYIFIEFQSFFEAFHAVQAINNLSFQDQRLKAQIAYGSSESHKGQYKSTLELDHYQSLVKKLKDIRCFYSELL